MAKILIVEDSMSIRLFLSRILVKNGHTISAQVDTGELALESIAADMPDLILMDINLSGNMDGIEAAGIIMERWSIPVIYVTSEYSDNIMQRAAKTLPYAYLRKPVEGYQLIADVDLALRRKSIEVELEGKRKEFESRLKTSEEKYRRLSDDMPVMVCTFLADSTLTYVNKAYCDFFKMSEKELTGRKWLDLLPSECREEVMLNYRSLSVKSPITAYEHRVIRPDGIIGWHKWTDRALFDEDGGLIYYQSIGEDITEYKRTEEELRRNEALLRIAGDLARLGGWSVNLKENQVTWSDQVAAIHDMPAGYSPTVDEGISFYAPEYQERIIKAFNACATQGIPYDEELQIITGKGRRIWVRTIGTAERDESGKIVRVQGGFQDLSERKGLEMKLTHAQKVEAVGELAAGIAHEINTPAQYVADNTRFLKDAYNDILKLIEHTEKTIKKLGDESVFKSFEEIKKQADYSFLLSEIPKSIGQSLEGLKRINSIVQAMKKFSHPGHDDQLTTFDLKSALESTITISRNEWKYVADVRTEFEPGLSGIQGYPHDLNQVFLNLIVNAAHAIREKVDGTDEKGLITVKAAMKDNDVEVKIEDTGTGIPEKHQNRVFDQFFTTKPVGRGTGQGLAIAYSIVVNRHRGSITFETQPGKGTVFIVRLPQANLEG